MLLPLIFIFAEPIFAVESTIKISNYSSNSSPEWVEIYNQSDTTVDINNWTIRDGNNILTDDLTITGCLSSHNYVTFYHDSGWLNDSSPETISLYDLGNNLIDQLNYTKGQLGNNPRSDNICIPSPTLSPTFTPIPIPTATFAPLPTMTSTPTPIPTIIPTPTSILTTTKTPTPTKTPSLTPTETVTPFSTPPEEVILTNLSDQNTPTENPTPTSNSVLGVTKTNNKNYLPLIFICLGAFFLLTPLILAKIKHEN
ncbi:MAG: lamin tail domain-containing protein [Candidatus Shapirobacteria bacterium]|nr:lamin tail domain-containing protein [Candidatus Shapirobacteria bacterium]MDD4410647.1 lamin tail domain-containing protein [Candidatus Shapirobacteria bacterium]